MDIFYFLSIFASLLAFSTVFSGFLMFKLKKTGVYLSLIQAPFRVLLVISPTLFFLSSLSGFVPDHEWIIYVAILAVEVLKIISECSWLKVNKKSKTHYQSS